MQVKLLTKKEDFMQVGIKVLKVLKNGNLSSKGKVINPKGLSFITGDTLTATLQVKQCTNNIVETHNYPVHDMPAFQVLQLLKAIIAVCRNYSSTFTITVNGNTLVQGASYCDYIDVLPNKTLYLTTLTQKA